MAEVLIIESDRQWAHQLTMALKQAGHGCRVAHSAAGVRDSETSSSPALVIMDARLPWSESHPLLVGFAQRKCPVLFITRQADSSEHLMALYPGPSQVLVWPFEDRELASRAGELIKEAENRLTLGSLEINLTEKAVMLEGEPLSLTAQEFALLQALMSSPETALSREQLLRTAWGYQGMGETRTVDVHVQRLRKKLGVERIETVYKLGYRLRMA